MLPPALNRLTAGVMRHARNQLGDTKLLVHVLVVVFATSSWADMNGLWVELPLFVLEAPEGWDLPSYITIISQVANVGPLLFVGLSILLPHTKNRLETYASFVIIAIGTVSAFLLAFLWRETSEVGGVEHSTALLVLNFFLALGDCTSSVCFYAFMALLKPQYMASLLLGEGLSGMLPAMIALGQGAGDIVCVNQSHTTNQTFPNGTQYNVTTYDLYPQYVQPNFSVQVFFFTLTAILASSGIAFLLLNILPACQSEMLDHQTQTSTSRSEYEQIIPADVEEDGGIVDSNSDNNIQSLYHEQQQQQHHNRQEPHRGRRKNYGSTTSAYDDNENDNTNTTTHSHILPVTTSTSTSIPSSSSSLDSSTLFKGRTDNATNNNKNKNHSGIMKTDSRLSHQSSTTSSTTRLVPPPPSSRSFNDSASTVISLYLRVPNISLPRFATLLLVLVVINLTLTSFLSTVQIYSTLPYGLEPFHLTTTLTAIANPVACFWALLVAMTKRLAVIAGVTVLGLGGVVYIIFLAVTSPTPPLYQEDGGAVLAVCVWIMTTLLLIYAKVCVAGVMRDHGRNALIWAGIATQVGSLIGALVGFILTQDTHIFVQAHFC